MDILHFTALSFPYFETSVHVMCLISLNVNSILQISCLKRIRSVVGLSGA
jgi:hypothetical protein